MNIRMRMASRALAVGGMLTAALVHAAWAAGSTWPADSPDELADLVVGRRPLPSPVMCLGVTALLTGAAGVVALDGTSAVRSRRMLAPAVHGAASTAGGVLALRGVGGFVASGLRLGRATDLYHRWNLRLYSPICMALATATVAGRAGRRAA